MSKDSFAKYYQEKDRHVKYIKAKARERYQNLSKEEIMVMNEKRDIMVLGLERYKNLFKYEKKSLVEYRKKCKMRKNASQ